MVELVFSERIFQNGLVIIVVDFSDTSSTKFWDRFVTIRRIIDKPFKEDVEYCPSLDLMKSFGLILLMTGYLEQEFILNY